MSLSNKFKVTSNLINVIDIDRTRLLDVNIDSQLSFYHKVEQLSKKSGKKLHVLPRVARYVTYTQKRLLIKSFITFQFSYCPLIWMFHHIRNTGNRIGFMKEP